MAEKKLPAKYTTKNIFEHPINESAEFNEAFSDFLDMRKKLRKPATDRAIKLLILKLVEMANGREETIIKLLDQSIVNSWLDFYPLREDRQSYGGGFNNNGNSGGGGKTLKEL